MAPLGLLRSLYRRLPQPPSTNYLYRKISPNPIDLLPANPTVFDIGSKDARGSYAFGALPKGSKLVCVDLAPGPGVDLVADIHNMHMVASNSVDFVACISVLEHVRDPQLAMKEILRIVKPGGIVYINVPFVFPFHADPDDFYRFTFKGINLLCSDFERIDSGFNRGPASTMHHLLVHFLAMLLCFNSRALYGVLVDLLKWPLFWMKYLDKFLATYQMAYVIHAGAYFLGRKRPA